MTNKDKQTSVVRIRMKDGVITQDCDVYIGRRCFMGGWELPESKWHNPYSAKNCKSVTEACTRFKEYIYTQPILLSSIHELKGKRLGCWCKSSPSKLCHGDILAKLANSL
jgi:hypothetical protein